MIRPLSAREQKILAVCLILGAAMAVHRLVIRPLHGHEQDVDRMIKERQHELSEIQGLVRGIATVEQSYQRHIRLFGQQNSDEKEMSSMISDIGASAGRWNVHVSNMQTQKVVIAEGGKLFGVQIVLEGSPVDIAKFLYQLQNAPHFFDLGNLELEKAAAREGIVSGRLSLTKRLFDPVLRPSSR